jgi:NitT/TauT family transport system substrate-binding protein
MQSREFSAFVSVVLAGLLLAFAGCKKASSPAASAATALIPITLQTNWYAEAEYGGYYQALAKGYFKEAGLDVRIQQGGPGAYPVQKIAANQVQFAVARSDDIILAAQQKLPVLMLSSQLEHDPQIICLHDQSPVRDFADLGGHSIMVEPGSAWISYIQKKYHITINTIPENYGNAQFLSNPDFIQQGFVTNEPFIFDRLKVPNRFLLISDSGYDPYRALFTNKAYALEHPDVVRAFVKASIRGWKDYLEGDPAPATALIFKDYPESTPEVLAFAREKMIHYQVAAGDPVKGERIGLITRQRLAEQIAILKDLGLLTEPVTVDQVASFDFLPPDLKALAE